MEPQERQYNNDHDLLIELRTVVKGVAEDVRELRDNFAKRVSDLEAVKASKDDVSTLRVELATFKEAHDIRLRRLEWIVALGIGGLYAFKFISEYVLK